MTSETKSIFLYGNPTKVKLKILSEIQLVYTNKINEFIELMLSDSSYYLDLFNNNKKSPLIRELEKANRGDLGSALGQNAIDHAVKELHNHLIRIKNDLYGDTLNTDSNLFVSHTSLLNASIRELSYEDVIDLLKSLNPKSKKEQRDYQELITQLETFGKEKVEFLIKDVQTLFNLELRHRKIPLVKKAPVQLDSRLFTLEIPEKVKADFVIKIKKLDSQKEKGEDIRIPIPIKTSSNSLRRIKQYKKSNTATFTITEKGKLKIAIPFEKKITPKSDESILRGVDIGITDLMVDSENKAYGSFVSVNYFYNTKVLTEQAKLNQLRNQMRAYQKELKNKKTPEPRKAKLRKKIFNLNAMLMKNKSLSRALRRYYHRQEEVLSKAVNDYFETIKGTQTTTVIESLDIREFNRSKAENRRDSMWARGKLTEKLISKLNWHGYEVIEVDPTYTSQMCSKCFCIHEENRHYKEFKCHHCGMETDADYNASINIKNRATDKKLQAIIEKYKYNQTLRHQEIKKYLMNQHQAFIKIN